MSTHPTQGQQVPHRKSARDPTPDPMKDGRAGQPVGPLYVYYCVFAKDELMESKHAIYGNDRSIGRVLVKSIPPPHTARSISRILRKIEGFKVSDTSQLFVPLGSQTAEEDSSHVSLSSHSLPGLSEQHPMALVVESEGGLRNKEAVENLSRILITCEISYIHYRLYSAAGVLVSNTSFKEDDPSLGRINILSIKPPQTVTSLKRRIAKLEALLRFDDAQIFENILSDKAISDGILSFLGDGYPGKNKEQPTAFICNPLDQATTLGRMLTDANESSPKVTFVYYRKFSEDGEVASKMSFDEDDPSLGRINIFSVKPPHTTKALKDSIANAESLRIITDVFPDIQLVANIFSENPMIDGPISLHEESHPGREEGEPMALVYNQDEQAKTSRKVLSKHSASPYPDPNWIPTYKAGEIFYTNGIKQRAGDPWGLEFFDVYWAYSETCENGYVLTKHMDFVQD